MCYAQYQSITTADHNDFVLTLDHRPGYNKPRETWKVKVVPLNQFGYFGFIDANFICLKNRGEALTKVNQSSWQVKLKTVKNKQLHHPWLKWERNMHTRNFEVQCGIACVVSGFSYQ